MKSGARDNCPGLLILYIQALFPLVPSRFASLGRDTFLVWRISSHTVVFLKMQPTVRTTQLSRKNQYTVRAGSSRRSHLFSTVITSTADKVAPSTVISRLPAMYPRHSSREKCPGWTKPAARAVTAILTRAAA